MRASRTPPRRSPAKAPGAENSWQASMRRWSVAPSIRADFGNHKALGSITIARQNELAGPQFGQSEAPQRFHVDEDLGMPFPFGEETEPTHPVEPFHLEPHQL